MFPKGVLRESAPFLNLLLHLLDYVAICLAGMLAYRLHFGDYYLASPYLIALLSAILLATIVFPLFSMYRVWRGFSRTEEFRASLFAISIIFIALITASFLLGYTDYLDRQWVGAWFLASVALVVSVRMLLRIVLGHLRAQGFNLRRVVVFGDGELGAHVVERLERSGYLGMDLVGYFSDTNPVDVGRGVRVTGSINKGLLLLRRFRHVDQIWLAIPMRKANELQGLLDEMTDLTATIRFIPDLFGFRLMNLGVSSVAGLPMVEISSSPMHGVNRLVKEIEDRVLASMILLLVSPLMAAIAIGVKLSSPGPVFYRQQRVSWNGKKFQMLKFRSMPVGAEKITGAVWARPNENRATRFGRFLRRTSLDELPQFWNVLMGDMSIVGPRPERPVFVNKFKGEIPGYMQKHMVKAGITGWAQVCGWRGQTDLNKRIEYDLYYIEHWSLWFDLKIIFLTLVRGFIHKNAY